MSKEQLIDLALQAAVALCVAIVVTLAWHLLDKKHHQRVAVVDIATIMKAKEAQFTELLSKPSVTDDDRRKAYDQIQRFGADVGAAVKDLSHQCGCIVLNKAAIIAGDVEDLTPSLKTTLGMP